jgi:pimeloyl-ACP methyl ester carboxylesterase
MTRANRSLSLALLWLTGGCGGASPDLAGSWIGEIKGSAGADRLEVTIDSAGARAIVSLRSWELRGDTAVRGAIGPGVVRFALARAGDSITIEGQVGPSGWRGQVTRSKDTAQFEARRIHRLTDAEWASIVGAYRRADSGLVTVATFTEFGDRPMLVDHRSGRIGPLIPISGGRFLLGAALVAPVFSADSVELGPFAGGKAAGLRLILGGAAPIEGRRIETREEEVRFQHDSVSLGGTLILPAGPPPYPALVLVHGSNALTRDVFGPWSRFFAATGFAVLAFDKRGTGGSNGDWRKADFLALAGDVSAGVRFLAKRADIRRDRIGLWGASQAGWIMPVVAATMADTIAFMVVHAGTGTTVREQGRLNLRQELRASGLPDSSVTLALRYQEIDDRVTETGRGWEEVDRFYQEHRPANAWLWPPSPLDSWFRPYYRMLMPFDPAGYWRRVRCPVLFFFGELDANVPPPESWPPIERALTTSGNRAVTHVVLPKANHLFFEAATGGRDEYPHLSRFVPGYFDRMAAWLAERVAPAASSQ